MPKILEAELQYFNDAGGFRYGNGPQLCVTLDTDPPDKKYKFYPEHEMFISEDGGWISAHWHNGSDLNAGGYCGRWFEITMEDGTQRTLKGPWMGGAGDVSKALGKDVVEIHVRTPGWKTYSFGYFCTTEKAQEILKFVRPFKEDQGHQFQVVLVKGIDQYSPYSFAIIKTPWTLKNANIILTAEISHENQTHPESEGRDRVHGEVARTPE